MECDYCGKKLTKIEGKKKVNPKRKFCNESCKQKTKYYISKQKRESWTDKEKEDFLELRRKSTEKWRNNNRRDYREAMKKYYNKNKVDKRDKWNCRAITAQIFRGKKDFCKKCGEKDNLQIHHEVYPNGTKEIKRAYKEGKIYFVCYDCHRNIHKKLRDEKTSRKQKASK